MFGFECHYPKFMAEIFQIPDGGGSILDILSTMISPEAATANAVRKHQVACQTKQRRKRSLENSSATAATTSKLLS